MDNTMKQLGGEGERLVALKESLDAATRSLSTAKMFGSEYTVQKDYDGYAFAGRITDELERCLGHMPSTEEIILLVDGLEGFTERIGAPLDEALEMLVEGTGDIGATCAIYKDTRAFKGYVDMA